MVMVSMRTAEHLTHTMKTNYVLETFLGILMILKLHRLICGIIVPLQTMKLLAVPYAL
jgi:hypothetical protein